mmetsp:Transcript_21583/g.43755  ORF Transcript_21583/g.43755 Transcript_21583/m.43755 type:complete len:223 (-) Transcript_21583:262-930(-)
MLMITADLNESAPALSLSVFSCPISRSRVRVNASATCSRASSDQSPTQSMTQRLNNAGEVAVRLLNSGLAGFIVKMMCRFFCTSWINRLYSSSSVSSMKPSRCAASRHCCISDGHSSPSNNPGISPDASNAFMSSKNPVDSTLLSSKMKQIVSALHPARFITLRRSSSKSASPYPRWALIWKTVWPLCHATKRDMTVLPAPLAPMSSTCPSGCRSTRSMRST